VRNARLKRWSDYVDRMGGDRCLKITWSGKPTGRSVRGRTRRRWKEDFGAVTGVKVTLNCSQRVSVSVVPLELQTKFHTHVGATFNITPYENKV